MSKELRPTPKPTALRTGRTAKRKMEWCVVLACTNRKQAELLPDMLIVDGYIGYIPYVRQLPARRAGRDK